MTEQFKDLLNEDEQNMFEKLTQNTHEKKEDVDDDDDKASKYLAVNTLK